MLSTISPTLDEFMKQGPYVGYSYSYPHKTAYREFEQPRPLSELWHSECQDSLFLYVHIPFCEMRCGFCNLFTFSQPQQDVVASYLDALQRQAQAIRGELPNARFSRLAIGGGTPSFLTLPELQRLFAIVETFSMHSLADIPTSFEVSPGTVDREKLQFLSSLGVDRVSMGVQSFNATDVAAMGRPQNLDTVVRSVEMIHELNIPTLNLDLIYGANSQSLDTWIDSVDRTIEFQPEEIYLYPLYVRPLTGLERIHRQPSDQRSQLYRVARDRLSERGFEQVSMRMFKRTANRGSYLDLAPDYSCQRDGMIGLGCGARSYTQRCHYGSQYAVKQKSILTLIHRFNSLQPNDFREARFGFALDANEQRRRFLILTLLLAEGLSRQLYEQTFGTCVLDEFPELVQLETASLCEITKGRIRLTPLGLEWSDTIGPWLYSTEVRARMEEYEWIG